MSMRVKVHQLITAESSVMDLLPGGVHQGSSLENVPTLKPFLVHRFANEVPEIKDAGQTLAMRQQCTLWVHDDPGNYENIDEVLAALTTLLEAASSDLSGFMQAEWLFTSDDLRDEEMGTIQRFIQWQITSRRVA